MCESSFVKAVPADLQAIATLLRAVWWNTSDKHWGISQCAEPAVLQAFASPLSGLVGDRYDRAKMVAAGCFLWGIMTSAVGLSTSLGQVCSCVTSLLQSITHSALTRHVACKGPTCSSCAD